jgi:hypothetical protein
MRTPGIRCIKALPLPLPPVRQNITVTSKLQPQRYRVTRLPQLMVQVFHTTST